MELQVIDMSIKEANAKIMHLENLLEVLLSRKELLLSNTEPHATDYSKEVTQGGTRENIFLKYVIQCDEEDIDNSIDITQQEIYSLTRYIDKELKNIGEYEPLKAKIILLREKSNMTWEKIAESTNYSLIQCKRIYKQYIEKRFFE